MNYTNHPSLDAYLTDINQAAVFIAESRKATGEKQTDEPENFRDRENKRLGRFIHHYSLSGARYKFLKRKSYEQSRNDLVSLNLPHVIKVAKRYTNKGIPLDDLIQEGNLGLIRAVEKYNPDHTKEGIKFTTYAEEWIKSFIKKAMQEKLRDNLPIPYGTCSDRERIEHITSSLEKELKEQPTSQQVAERFNLTYYPNGPKNYQISHYHVEGLWVATTPQERIDKLNDHGENYGDVDSGYQTPLEIVSNHDELEKMLKILETSGILDEREKTILIERYGLYGKEEMTLKKIGDELGLTRERVRQIERDSLLKLKNYMNRSPSLRKQEQTESEETIEKRAA